MRSLPIPPPLDVVRQGALDDRAERDRRVPLDRPQPEGPTKAAKESVQRGIGRVLGPTTYGPGQRADAAATRAVRLVRNLVSRDAQVLTQHAGTGRQTDRVQRATDRLQDALRDALRTSGVAHESLSNAIDEGVASAKSAVNGELSPAALTLVEHLRNALQTAHPTTP